MAFKTHKKKKSKGQRGRTTYGHGARKKWHSSGHHGGCGMAGTGKRADHKKSLIIKLYGNNYFGKQGVTSRGTAKNHSREINIREIESNLESLMKKFGKGDELVLEEHKVLGDGELSVKLIIRAKAFSAGAKEKIEKAGGKWIVSSVSKETENSRNAAEAVRDNNNSKEKTEKKEAKPKIVKKKLKIEK